MRLSSGAATLEDDEAVIESGAQDRTVIAAPKDGRTPAKLSPTVASLLPGAAKNKLAIAGAAYKLATASRTNETKAMTPIEDYQDVLQNIEQAVVQVWQQNPAMTNYVVMAAYDAAINYYRAAASQQEPKPVTLKGLDAKVFEAVKEMCEWRLGRAPGPEEDDLAPIPLEDLVACLRKLRKSVDFWTKQGGRQAYMQYIEKYVG